MAGNSHTTDAQNSDAGHPAVLNSGSSEMSVDEATESYANEWILMEITENDERGWPLRGRVLDHHRSRDQIQPMVLQTIERVKAATTVPETVRGYTVFYGVRRFRSAAEWEEFKRQTSDLGGERGSGR